MDFIRSFNQITKEDVRLAGGKGASLGEMTQAGIPVPPGFVILSNAFERFLGETDLNIEIDSVLHSVNHKEIHTVEDASEKIKALILDAKMPNDIGEEIKKFFAKLRAKYVAVRSSATAEDSATAAWAGQLESYLNTTEKDLLDNIKKCWASLFTPRAIFYRFEKGLHKQKISVAVVVQKMVESEKSGIAFSVHPVTQDYNQLIIEAGFGLGEAIVSGQITPDSYVIEKQPRRTIDKNVEEQSRGLYRSSGGGNDWQDIPKEKGEKQTLTDKEILELSDIVLKIENHYGFPVDIEWALEKGKFYIVQSRPITTLKEQKTLDSSKGAEHKHVWIKTFSRPHTIQRISFLWPYFLDGIPQNRNIRMQELLVLPSDKKYDYYIHEDEWMNCLEKISEMILGINAFEQEKELRRVADDWEIKAKQVHNQELSNWKKDELVAWFRNFSKSYANFALYAFTPWAIDFVLAPHLFERLNSINPQKSTHWFEAISTPTRPNRMTQQRMDLLRIAIKNGDEKLTRHAEKYFWLPVYNLGDRPWTEKDFQKHLDDIKNPKEELDKIIKDFEQRETNYFSVLKEIQPDENLKRLIEIVHLYTFLRDERVDRWRVGLYYIYDFYLEIARRAKVEIDDIVNLLDAEILSFLQTNQLPLRLEKRKVIHAILFRGGTVQILVDETEIKNLQTQELGDLDKSGVTELRGLGAFKGIATGKARIIREPKDLPDLQKGEILIAHHTSPEYVIAMKKAAAIVTDEGGITSHAAIVSRELKIPCITATHESSGIIKTGDLVEVDANKGIVRILEKGKEETRTGVTINGVAWNLFVTRNMSFWHQVISNFGHYHHAKDWGMRIPLQLLHLTVHGTQTHVFKTSKNAYAFDAEVLEIFSTEQKIAKIKQFYEIFAKELLNRLDQCLKELTLETWVAFSESYGRFTHGLAVTATIGRIGMDQLAKKLQELKTPESEIPSVISAITYPSQHTPLFNSSLDMLKIGEKIQSGKRKKKAIEKELKIWLKKYGHIPVNFVDEPWSLDDAKKQLENFLQKDCRKEIEALNANHAKRSSASDKLLKKIGDKKISLLAHALQEATYLNEFRKNVFSKVSLKMRPLFIQIAAKAGSKSWKDCYYLTPDEILDIFKGKIQSIGNIVKKRDIVGMYTTEKGELAFLNETETKEVYGFIQSLHSKVQSTKEAEILRGFSANSGHIKGIVKIILNSKDFSKLQPGEILVTTMTSVDFVPVMEKAAAFVTNEGGITSHAAIVAREMNKPCIIGTKIATKVLKDGDMVEVDADSGTVRIINKIETERVMELYKQEGKVGFYQIMLPFLSTTKRMRKYFTHTYEHVWTYYLRGFFICLFEKDKMREISDEFIKRSKRGFPEVWQKEWKRNAKELYDLSKKISKLNLNKLSNKELWNKYKEIFEKDQKMWSISIFIDAFDPGFDQEEIERISRKFSFTAEEAHILLTPKVQSYITEVENRLYKIKKGKVNINKFLDEYYWYGTDYSSFEEVDENFVKKLIEQAEYSEFKDPFLEQEMILKKYKLDKNPLEVFQILSQWRDERKRLNYIGLYGCIRILREGLKRQHIDFKHINNLSPDDIQNVFLGKIKEDALNQIYREGVLMEISSDGSWKYLNGKEAQDRFKHLSQFLPDINVKEIFGNIACGGKAKGTVRIIPHYASDSAKKMRRGDILVTSMTRPEFVPLMRKAGAIVTNEGGISCHAAIVSRELNIPCIIGTKIATQALKDGDLVEVDADNGIVRIIK